MTRGFINGEYEDGEVRGCGFVAGKRGMGKSWEMARKLNQCAGGSLFWDPLARHDPVMPGAALIHQPGTLAQYLQVNRTRRYRVLYQPKSGDIEQHFQAVCRIVRAIGWMVFGIDELDLVSGNHWGPSWMCPELNHLVQYGRHCRVSLLATARYPNNVPRGFTSQCASMFLFRLTEPAHIKYFEQYIGKADATRLPGLRERTYLRWDDNGLESTLCSAGIRL